MSDPIEALRARMAGRVRGPAGAFDLLWAPFVDGGYAEEVLDGHMSEEEGADKLRGWLNSSRTVSGDDERVDTEGGDLGAHQAALGAAVASVANTDEAVVAFRERWVPARPTSSDEVRAWVHSHLRSVRMAGADEMELSAWLLKSTVKWVDFEGHRHTQPTTGAPALEELMSTARRVARRYGYREAEAATFVVTGATVDVPMVRARMGARVVLDVHPDTPAAEVARIYVEARSRVAAGRPRLLSRKVAEAVVAAHAVPGTWDRRNLALQEAGHACYSTGDDMRRVVERATAKLLGDRDGHRPIDRVRKIMLGG